MPFPYCTLRREGAAVPGVVLHGRASQGGVRGGNREGLGSNCNGFLEASVVGLFALAH